MDDHFIHTTRFGTVTVEYCLVKRGVGFVFPGHGKDARWLANDNYVIIFKYNIDVLL